MIIEIEATSKMPNSPISAFGLNRNPRNICIYSSDYVKKPNRLFHKKNPDHRSGILQIIAPALTSDYFSIFEITSSNYSEVGRRRWPTAGGQTIASQSEGILVPEF